MPVTPISPSRTGRVRYALGALKGVGEKAMEALVEERTKGGPFASLEDFAARIDPRLLNRRQLESLAGAGAFDSIKADRPALYAGAETILAHAASAHEQRTSGQAGLFGANRAEAAPIRLPREASWTLPQRMAAERDAFGFYFSAHPVDAAKHLLAAHQVKTFAELADVRINEGERASATMAALAESVRWRSLGPWPALHDCHPVGPFRPVRSDRFRRGTRRRAGCRGQGRRLRAADSRARPPRW